jgi:hypothetical protein
VNIAFEDSRDGLVTARVVGDVAVEPGHADCDTHRQASWNLSLDKATAPVPEGSYRCDRIVAIHGDRCDWRQGLETEV